MAFSIFRRPHAQLRPGLWFSLFQFLAILAIGALLLVNLRASLRRGMDAILTQDAARVAGALGRSAALGLDADAVTSALNPGPGQAAAVADATFIRVLDRSGSALGASANLPADQLSAPAGLVARALAGERTFADSGTGPARMRVLAQPFESNGQIVGVVLAGRSLRAADETLRQTAWFVGLAALAALLIALAASRWLTAHTLRPIVEVTRVAQRIAATGHVGERVAVPPARGELYELASTLNEMLEHLEQIVRRQRQFLADASHELRGPLMVIRGNLDLLQMDLPAEDRAASAREASEEAERMARLVGDLLFLAEQDAHERMDSAPVALNEVVDEVWQRAWTLDAGRHELKLECNEPAAVLGDRYRLSQMLWNLVDNALRYTNAGGRVSLCLRVRGEAAELAVADTGISIPAEHVPHIFERFYRVDRARSRNESSTGLGLPIVKQVAEAHGGEVRVHSRAGMGTTFTVILPVLHNG